MGKTDPNGKLKGDARWEKKRSVVYGDDRKDQMETGDLEREIHSGVDRGQTRIQLERQPWKEDRLKNRTRNRHRWVSAECTKA